jgi:hypothetical protein
MYSNLSIIFGEIKSERKKARTYKKEFADKIFEQFTVLLNGQEFLASLLQKESSETKKLWSLIITSKG